LLLLNHLDTGDSPDSLEDGLDDFSGDSCARSPSIGCDVSMLRGYLYKAAVNTAKIAIGRLRPRSVPRLGRRGRKRQNDGSAVSSCP
jgi:hypothetical protein